MTSICGIELAEKGYFISLESSKDRQASVQAQIDKYNIQGLEMFPALTDPLRQCSCTKSYQACFKQADNLNIESLLMLEDDFQIYDTVNFLGQTISFSEMLETVMEEAKNLDWDIIQFGCNPKNFFIPVTPHLSLNSKSSGSWAFLIKRKAYQYIANNFNYYKDYLAIDDILGLMNRRGFKCYTTTPLLINHAVGFESLLNPQGPVNYNSWIDGNYEYFLYKDIKGIENYVDDFNIERKMSVVIAGHFVDDTLFYLRYLFKTLPPQLKKCKFYVVYDNNGEKDRTKEIHALTAYFKDIRHDYNVEIHYVNGGLISTMDLMLKTIHTSYFLLLEHDWIFLNRDINFDSLIKVFDNYNFVHAVWFNKDENIMKPWDFTIDSTKFTTPYAKEERINDVDLLTTIRWSNNPAVFRTSKYLEWWDKYIDKTYINKCNQGSMNIEETIIPIYRKTIEEGVWTDLRDNWGTYVYGKLNDGPIIAHADGSKRYTTTARSQPEINAENFIKENPLNERD